MNDNPKSIHDAEEKLPIKRNVLDYDDVCKVVPFFKGKEKLVNRLFHWLAVDKTNDYHSRNMHLSGPDFSHKMFEELGAPMTIRNEEVLSSIPDGPFITVSNHPYGALDGMALISLIGHRYDGEIKFIVNDLLMAVKPFDNVFMPVNKYGRQSRENALEIEKQYHSDKQMITFPAGLCSRRLKRGVIGDLTWQKFVVSQAISSQRDIIPIYFDGRNSKFFYRFAKIREWLGIKFNLEMIFLPSEMFKAQGKSFNVYFGEPIKWQSLDARKAKQEAARIRDLVYTLKKP